MATAEEAVRQTLHEYVAACVRRTNGPRTAEETWRFPASSRAVLVAIFIAGWLLIGCGSRRTEGDLTGFSPERLGRVAQAMQRGISNGVMAGAVTLIAQDRRLVHFEAHGYLDAARKIPMRKDALFRIASMTKPIVSVATMILVEQGAVNLNDPISRWLPELKDMKSWSKRRTRRAT